MNHPVAAVRKFDWLVIGGKFAADFADGRPAREEEVPELNCGLAEKAENVLHRDEKDLPDQARDQINGQQNIEEKEHDGEENSLP